MALVLGPAARLAALPSTMSDLGGSGDESEVERPEILVDRFDRPATEEHREPHLPALELAFVPQRGAGQRRHRDRGGPLRGWCERGRGPRFVVVLDEAQEVGLVVEVGVEVASDLARSLVDEAVVEALVVAVIEPELLEVPLHVPVGLGREQEVAGGRRGRRRAPRSSTPGRAVALPVRPRCGRRPRCAAAWPCRNERRRLGFRCRSGCPLRPGASQGRRRSAGRRRARARSRDRGLGRSPCRRPGGTPADPTRGRPRCPGRSTRGGR